MKKLFIAGIVIGVAIALAIFHFVPVVDQSREISIVAVTPNGGTSETFRINFPSDQIVRGVSSGDGPQPVGLEWPDEELLRNTHGELFKVRNERDAVIGIASRLTQEHGEAGEVVEWVVHLPARGSLYATMESASRDGVRFGDLRAGTREFDNRVGSMTERWVEDAAADDEFVDGRIELVTTYIARQPTEAGQDDS